jgi:predicted DNA-binding transcriptional regulator YafY
MANTATRLITLIMLLQRQPNQTAAQLGRALDVSVRTVQRYITMLDEMGIPIYAERGPYGGYALVRGYKMPPLVFTPEEAVAVYLGASFLEQVWGRLYQEAARGALAKLDNVLPDEQRREVAWARQTLLAIGMHWGNPNLSIPHLEKLWQAVHQRRRVRMTYRGRGQPEALQRDFDPYVLVHGWGWQYCLGYCHLRRGIRSFRVDRMLELELLEQDFEIPADFDLEAYVASEPYFQPQVRVRLYFAPEVALVALDNRAYWETLEEQPDGSVIVTFATPELEAAASVVLSYGYPAVVLEPEELRELVRERARVIAAQNASTVQIDEKQIV